MKIYVDSDFHCHTTNPDGVCREVETDFFDDKCNTLPCAALVEGYCCKIEEKIIAFYPWKNFDELAAAQAQYEADLAEAAAAYQEGVDSAYDQ